MTSRAGPLHSRHAGVPGLGRAQAARLARRGVTTRAHLRGVLDELPREAQAHLRHRVCRAIPASAAAAATEELRRRLVFGPAGGRPRRYPVLAVGSVRRRARVSKDLDLLVVVPDGAPLAGILAGARLLPPQGGDRASFGETYAQGDRRRALILRVAGSVARRPKRYALDLFLATAREKPYALLHFTGGRDYNIRVRAHAKRNGLVLNQYGLYRAGGRRRVDGSGAIRTERDLFRRLGVTYRPPEERVSAHPSREDVPGR